MKLTGRDAAGWIAGPRETAAGTLLYGTDAMRVALKRQDLVAALIGPQGDAEMRLTRMPAQSLKDDPAALDDAMRAQGFFPGRRCVLVEDATNAHVPPILAALKGWQPGDAHIVVTAGDLKPASALRKGFEAHPAAAAIGIYADKLDRAGIAAELDRAGLRDPAPDGVAALTQWAARTDPGDFRQMVEKLAIFKLDDPAPLSEADVAACAPVSTVAALDQIVALVADGRTAEIGPVMQRLESQGVAAVALCIALSRHFRMLHALACDPGGPGSGIGRLRPPVFGPRRDALLRQARDWGRIRLERALRELVETDLTLRSSSRAPAMAVMERAMLRLSLMPCPDSRTRDRAG
ncbi:hypothetical protein OCGS_1801 [Oceaniovalibus guishaninsula JLT2003]|uniref:DNA-directed DNA polymerase n=1 Tax=Oceaniovalibus guishaninsula JLT2003 TaxID=1231392 RepID=K2I5Q4_9RHOB|nr:hypothetical protein [Oceaniovalibus guishaninsula]EKE44285.1 hypothetical protein OCGS_1801 [Oceaniovalibus guishaninsula JLT2003]